MKFYNPLEPAVRITSPYGRRFIFNKWMWHNGIDLVSNKSDKIYASHSGTVTFSGVDQYNGKFIDIENGRQKTRYLHNRSNLVKKRDKVEAGEIIGYVGSTGLTTGAHLHFETSIDGKRVDPKSVVDFSRQPAKYNPVKEPEPTIIDPKTKVYTVKAGDTLSEIVANHYGLKSWPAIKKKYLEVAEYNGISNPNQIYVNQKIKLK